MKITLNDGRNEIKPVIISQRENTYYFVETSVSRNKIKKVISLEDYEKMMFYTAITRIHQPKYYGHIKNFEIRHELADKKYGYMENFRHDDEEISGYCIPIEGEICKMCCQCQEGECDEYHICALLPMCKRRGCKCWMWHLEP